MRPSYKEELLINRPPEEYEELDGQPIL